MNEIKNAPTKNKNTLKIQKLPHGFSPKTLQKTLEMF